MSCETIQERLDDLLDGALEDAEQRRVDDHLGSCLDCNRELRRRRELLDRARALPPLEPERDLWPDVAARIAPGERRPTRSRTLLAVAATLVAALAVPLLFKRDVAPTQQPTAAAPAVSEADLALAEAARWRDGTMRTRSALEVEIDKRRALLPAGVLDSVEEDLRILDRSVAELAAALEEDPFNRHLSSQLASRYQQEADMLKRISRI